MSAPYTKTMALLRYFKKKDDLQLPNPNGPLSSQMPSVAIATANREVKELVSRARDAENASDTKKTSRGQHLAKLTKKEPASPREHQNLVSQTLLGTLVKNLPTDL